MPVDQQLRFADLDELYLDPLNPRLGRHHTDGEKPQEEILKLIATWKIDELAVSFLESEQFWIQEALICVRERLGGAQRLVVVEGNRRLAALMYLKRSFAGEPPDRFWKDLIGKQKPPSTLFTRIPYLLASDRDAIESYLGFRHVTGIEEWNPSEKAEFISRMVDQGMTYEEVRRKIGARTETVRRNYISYRLLLQIEDIDTIPPENFEDRFSVMYLSLKTSGVRKYLHIDIEAPPDRAREPVPKRHLRALANFAQWLFGSEKSPPLFTDSRAVDTFARILESEKGVDYLEKTPDPSFDVAVRLTGGDEPEVLEQIEAASENLELALSRAHHFKRSARLRKAAERLGRNSLQLLALFPGLTEEFCKEK